MRDTYGKMGSGKQLFTHVPSSILNRRHR